MTAKELAVRLARIADAKKGVSIRVLNISDLTVLSDYFVIVSGTSTTHLKALSDEMEFTLKQEGNPPHHIEGYVSGSWILLDFGGVVVHLFLKDAREFYSLEHLWSDAPEIPFEDGDA